MLEIRDPSTIRQILRDRSFLPLEMTASLATLGHGASVDFSSLASFTTSTPFLAHGDTHKALRAELTSFFRPAMLEYWRPQINERARAQIEKADERDEICLVRDLAIPFLQDVAADVIGVPPLDPDRAYDLFRDAEASLEPLPRIKQLLAAQAALEVLCAHAEGALLDTSCDRPRTFVGHLRRVRGARDEISMQDLSVLVVICYITTVATANTFVNIAYRKLTNTGSFADFARRAWINDHLEDLLRAETALNFVVRCATVPTRIGTLTIEKGEILFLMLAEAYGAIDTNVSEPEASELCRRHLVFGAGGHTCPGNYLARIILEEGLLAVGKELRVVAITGPAQKLASRQIRTFTALPVRLKKKDEPA